MIDDVKLPQERTQQIMSFACGNFTSQPTYQNGSTEGWLDNVSAPNQLPTMVLMARYRGFLRKSAHDA